MAKKTEAKEKVKSYDIGRVEIRTREMEDGRKRATLYLHAGKKRFTLEYHIDDGMGNGYFPLVISEVDPKEEV